MFLTLLIFSVASLCDSFRDEKVHPGLVNNTDIPSRLSADIVPNQRDLEQNFLLFWEGASEHELLEESKCQLSSLARRLHSFIVTTRFGPDDLKANVDEFGETLRLIFQLLQGIKIDEDFANELSFAERIIEVMADTDASLRDISDHDFPEQRLIGGITKLNLKILALYDSRGFPDLERQGFAQEVYRLESFARTWNEQFSLLKSPSFLSKTRFKLQSRRAEKSLRVLNSYIPFIWLVPQFSSV